MRIFALCLTILLSLLAPQAHADISAGPIIDAIERTESKPAADSFVFQVKQLEACREVTDNCSLCRKPQDKWVCSTPGIACQPGPWRCIRDLILDFDPSSLD